MLEVTIPKAEFFDELNYEFIYKKEQKLKLEHSLISLSKWEEKWKKPFISDTPKTDEETIDYIRCMTLNQVTEPDVYERIPKSVINQVNEYIKEQKTATWFNEATKDGKGNTSGEAVTAELIYYWMVTLNIPFECQKWHLSKLLTLIRVCNIKNTPPKKMSKKEVMAQHRSINEQRRAMYNKKK